MKSPKDLLELEPKILWKYFNEIRKIPRCSKHEEKITKYIIETSNKLGMDVFQDKRGNIIVKRKASPGYENKPTVIFQSHIDMVCEKDNDISHDFSKDEINAYIDGDFVRAHGTTLGADNGIGMAICMALMEYDFKHPEMEFLFTVDEEIGMTGALNIENKYLNGKLLINLDSERFGSICIGCAGGSTTDIYLPIKFSNGGKGLKIQVKGLKGGHSGEEINKKRANSIKLLARILYNIDAKIGNIYGGSKSNAIPREAVAEVVVSDIEKSKEKIKDLKMSLKEEYRKSEPKLNIVVEDAYIENTLDDESNYKVIRMLMALPHGVFEMDQEIRGLVQTSTNLAKVEIIKSENKFHVVMNSRSSSDSSLNYVSNVIKSVSDLSGATTIESDRYPNWKSDTNSRLVSIAKESYEKLYGKSPKVTIIHGGLETGIIRKKTGIEEMISIGPDINHPHSPDENVKISTVKKLWIYLLEIMNEIAENY